MQQAYVEVRGKIIGMESGMERVTQAPVTVITPVHNGGRFLRECIESVMAQTYRDWEYLIVENCSTDDTYAIAKSYADSDPRIKVHKFDELLPMLKNHNRAFALLPEYSRYCKPLMADDWLYPECLARMVAAAEAHPSIGVVGCYGFNGFNQVFNGFPYPAEFVPGREALRIAMTKIGTWAIHGSPTSMLFRSDLVRKRKPVFNEQQYAADHEAAFDMLTESDFSFIHQVLCLNREHEESVTSKHVTSMDGYFASNAYLLHKYGPLCLNEQEMEASNKRVMKDYYRRLAHRWLRFNDRRKYFDFHRANFRQMNVPFEYRELAPAVGHELVSRLAAPGDTLRRIVRRLVAR